MLFDVISGMIFLNPNEDMSYDKCKYSHEDTIDKLFEIKTDPGYPFF